jgi:outer membrane protein insertion porin family
MRRENLLAILVVLAGMAFLASSRATAAEGDKIVELRVVLWDTEEGAVYADQIREKIMEETGGVRQEAKIKQILEDFTASKILFRYRIREQAVEPGKVRIIIDVEENTGVRAVMFFGRKKISNDKLMGVVHTRVGQPLSLPVIHQDARRIEALYKEEGYLFVNVGTPAQGYKNGVVVFEIEEGPLVRVRQVSFEGNYHFSEKVLAAQISTKPRRFFGILSKGIYSEATLEEDLDKIARFYRSEGYLNVLVGVGKIEYSESRSDMYITIYIEEHELFHVGKIVFNGTHYFTESEIKARMRLREKGPFKVSDYVADLATIENMYAEMAYIDAVIGETEEKPTVVYHKDEPIVDLYFNVTENQEVYIGNIYVLGNTYTQDKVLRREFSFYPGEKFNMTEIEASRSRLQRLGGYQDQYFQEVMIEPVPKKDERIENGRRVRDVYVKVVESESFGRIRFGAAISSNEGLMGDISLVRSNFDIADLPKSFKDMFVDRTAFLGAGQYFAMEAQPGLKFSRYSVNFSEPYLFGTPTSMGLSLFMWDRLREKYTEGRSGFNTGLSRRLPGQYSVGVDLRLESVNIKSLDESAPPDVVAVKGTNSVYGVRFGLTKDTLDIDRFFKPYGGYRSYASIEPVFGDFSLVKWMFGSSRYRTIYEDDAGNKHIIKLEGEIGFISGKSPVFERYYLGGANNLRGFGYRGVGPMQKGDPVGGNSILFGTVEYSFPIIGDTIRGVTFFDFGTVNKNTFQYGNIRASVGFGVRIFSPQIPIPIDLNFGFPIRSISGDKTQIVSFTIGTEF